CGFALDVGMNCSGIECDRERAGGLKPGEVRRSTNDDSAAFHEINARLSRLYTNVAAAAKSRTRLAVDNFHVHGTGNNNGFTFDDANHVVRWVVGWWGGEEERVSGEQHCSNRQREEDRPPYEEFEWTRHAD